MTEERQRRPRLVRRERVGRDRRVVPERLGRQVGPLVVEAPVRRVETGEQYGIEDDRRARPVPERASASSRNAGRAREMMEHVDEDEVRDRPVREGKLLGVDDVVGPRRRLDVGGSTAGHVRWRVEIPDPSSTESPGTVESRWAIARYHSSYSERTSGRSRHALSWTQSASTSGDGRLLKA